MFKSIFILAAIAAAFAIVYGNPQLPIGNPVNDVLGSDSIGNFLGPDPLNRITAQMANSVNTLIKDPIALVKFLSNFLKGIFSLIPYNQAQASRLIAIIVEAGIFLDFTSIGGDNVGVGGLTLPLALTCRLPYTKTVISDVYYAACVICSLDCTYVHNSYSGQCGNNPYNNTDYTCLCNYDNTTAGVVTKNGVTTFDGIKAASELCSSYLLDTSFIDYLDIKLIKTAFITRYAAEQCPLYSSTYSDNSISGLLYYPDGRSYTPGSAYGYQNLPGSDLLTVDISGNGTGCSIDCLNNHGDPCGLCLANQVARYDTSKRDNFCMCSNSTYYGTDERVQCTPFENLALTSVAV